MKYFFVLGINPTLSLAELAAVFNHGELALAQKNIAILETDQKIEANIIKKIGGTIKFGRIFSELNSTDTADILGAAEVFAKPEKSRAKFYFGISFYGKAKIYPVKSSPAGAKQFHGVNLKVLGMEFKKLLKQSGIPSRWVVSREATLSSVVVEQNKLTTDRGAEIVIIQFDKKLLLGKTLAVQPFKELSFRDYGRPGRDNYSGMLPPKLAQIMINLATIPPLTKGVGGILQSNDNATILDPFCGSGTILTEAALMDHRHLIGSDISAQAIQNAKKNIDWLKSNFQLSTFNFQLFHSDATQVSKHLPSNSVDAIITEPYLGPQRGRIDYKKTISELEKLYSESLREFKKILKPNGRIVIIWPVFQKKPLSLRGSASDRSNLANADIAGTLNPNLDNFKIINPIPENLRHDKRIKLTDRNTIIYGREGQKVWREIVILKKE